MEEQASTRRGAIKPNARVTLLAESTGQRTEVVHFSTSAGEQFVDITDYLRDVLANSGIRHGQVTAHTPHTTTTLAINESETGFINDFVRRLELLVPRDIYYEHDDWDVRTENVQEDEYINGQSHVRQMIVGSTSLTVPVVDGEVLLGQWQRLLFVELDQPRERRVILHAQGV